MRKGRGGRGAEKKLPIRVVRGRGCQRHFFLQTQIPVFFLQPHPSPHLSPHPNPFNPASPTRSPWQQLSTAGSVRTAAETMRQQQWQQPSVTCFIAWSLVFNSRSPPSTAAAGHQRPLAGLLGTVAAVATVTMDLFRCYSWFQENIR